VPHKGQSRPRSPSRQRLHPKICKSLPERPLGGKIFDFTVSPFSNRAAQSGQVRASPRRPSGMTGSCTARAFARVENENRKYTKIAAKKAITAVPIIIFILSFYMLH
jgi:hypothetical protein